MEVVLKSDLEFTEGFTKEVRIVIDKAQFGMKTLGIKASIKD